MKLDLKNDKDLTDAIAAIQPRQRNPEWLQKLTDFLTYVQGADLATRKAQEFHQRLWDDNDVSGVGMGNVDISAAVENADFRVWLAEESLKPLPANGDERRVFLCGLYDQLEQRIKAFASRTPRVKIMRAIAGLYPGLFTTITYGRMALSLHRALFATRK